MKPLPPEEGKISQAHTSGVFLEKPGLLKKALERNQDYKDVVPGSFGQVISTESLTRSTTLEKALMKLKEEQASAKGSFAIEVNPNDDGQLIVTSSSKANGAPSTDIEDNLGDAEFEEFYNQAKEAEGTITVNIQKANEASPGIVKMGESKDPVVVFIRHGRTVSPYLIQHDFYFILLRYWLFVGLLSLAISRITTLGYLLAGKTRHWPQMEWKTQRMRDVC